MPDDLDSILDQALAGYIADPKPGLERRVLARVRRSNWRIWVALSTVAAAALLFVSWPTRVVSPKPVPALTASVPLVEVLPNPDRKGGDVPRRVDLVLRRPKTLDSVPISPQEQRLAAAIQAHPEAFANILAMGEPIQPLTTEPLEIKPLAVN